jgi:hypothetical protein
MPTITIKSVFDLGEEVYFITDPNQRKHIVLYVTKHWNGGIIYGVGIDKESHEAQAIELTREKDVLIGSEKTPEDE